MNRNRQTFRIPSASFETVGVHRGYALKTSPLNGIGYLIRPGANVLVIILLAILLSSCTAARFDKRTPAWAERLAASPPPTAEAVTNTPSTSSEANEGNRPDNDFYEPGTGQFVNSSRSMSDAKVQEGGDIKLNFQNANLLEVIKVILGDMLQASYVVDPQVQGSVSMQTPEALHRDALVPTLELLLRMNGAALITEKGLYKVVPLAKAATDVQAPQLGDSALPLPSGFSVRVMPLKYVAAEEMAQILTPLVSENNQLLRIDSQRNLLILAGSGADMARLIETVRIFDVDRMAGMSVAMFTPDFVDAKTLGAELDKLLSDPKQGLMAGMVRFMVIERLNALMVVTPRREYLAQVRTWIDRLDKESGVAGQRLFVYRVQNGKAAEIADILNQLYREDTNRPPPTQARLPKAKVAPELTKATVGKLPESKAKTPPQPGPSGKTTPLADGSSIRIIADEPNNALLILASAADYRQIHAALKQLDITPMQVLVEVTIAEVTLTDNLQYGVEWFFRNSVGSRTGVGTLDLGSIAGINPLQPGFSYALRGSNDVVKGVLNLLASESNLSVISSPTLLVLNNQEASIQVGDEVPVATRQQQAADVNANIINNIEYRETGIKLNVKPRINSGGLVIMDIEQEASHVPSTNNADPLTPRIQQRKIASTVAVNSGDSIMLGGLIQNNRDRSESGIPGLHTLPGLGALFGTKADKQDRTELLVLITPRAVSNRLTALQITEEFRRNLHNLVSDDNNDTDM
ncbi:MAG: type II secretion system secretin GspD [Sedimenticola sp.]